MFTAVLMLKIAGTLSGLADEKKSGLGWAFRAIVG